MENTSPGCLEFNSILLLGALLSLLLNGQKSIVHTEKRAISCSMPQHDLGLKQADSSVCSRSATHLWSYMANLCYVVSDLSIKRSLEESRSNTGKHENCSFICPGDSPFSAFIYAFFVNSFNETPPQSWKLQEQFLHLLTECRAQSDSPLC